MAKPEDYSIGLNRVLTPIPGSCFHFSWVWCGVSHPGESAVAQLFTLGAQERGWHAHSLFRSLSQTGGGESVVQVGGLCTLVTEFGI